MCGIAGFWGKGNESVMRAMTEALHHRGPDFTGTFFDPKMALGLGHARLSILDLSAGAHQPFSRRISALSSSLMGRFIISNPFGRI